MTEYHFAETKGVPGAPLIFTFHGTGGDETQFHGLARQLMPDAHVISPRGDVSEHGHLRFFRRKAEGVYDMDDLAARTGAMADFLRARIAETGARRVIGLGYSNGANILASVMLSVPGLVREAVLMHPLIPWTPDAQPGLAGARVLITASQRDPICPAAMTEALAKYLTAQGVDTQTQWHPGGHEIDRSELTAVTRFLADA